jgi:alpha-pyrone synthase
LPQTLPRIVSLATAVPDQDIHGAFIDWATARLSDPAQARLFARMARRAGIEHRFAALPPAPGSPVESGGFYAESMPPTSARMALYAQLAPDLAMQAIEALGEFDRQAITHIVVASCTGFTAPGIDQILAARLGLAATVERTLIGFMGCYAAVTALRTAMHIARSQPEARVLVVTVELSSLHLRAVDEAESLLAMLQFGDGAAAAIVASDGPGFSVEQPFAVALPDSAALIGWQIGDTGFEMHLSGEVPGRIGKALADPDLRATLTGGAEVDAWAVHAGGRSILDAVEHGLGLDADALAVSREVLRAHGNMSSATLMFALAGFINRAVERGVALAFGPGLAAEGFRFRSVA